jgi:hypothetical protein
VTRYYFLSESCGVASVGTLSDERTGLQFEVQSLNGPNRAEPVTILHSHLRLPQPGVPGSRMFIPQEHRGPVIPPGTGFPLSRLFGLVGLRWGYSNPPQTWRARSPYTYPPGTEWSSPKSKSKIKVTLRPTVSQSTCFGV